MLCQYLHEHVSVVGVAAELAQDLRRADEVLDRLQTRHHYVGLALLGDQETEQLGRYVAVLERCHGGGMGWGSIILFFPFFETIYTNSNILKIYYITTQSLLILLMKFTSSGYN